MDNKTFMSSSKQELGNMDKKTNYSLQCINCGCKKEINLVAHRNKDEHITGFIAVCSDCSRLLDKSDRTVSLVVEQKNSGGIDIMSSIPQPK